MSDGQVLKLRYGSCSSSNDTQNALSCRQSLITGFGSMLLGMIISLCFFFGLPTTGDAVSGTPAAQNPIGGGECSVAPRPVADFRALEQATPGIYVSTSLGAPQPTPPILPQGLPANDETKKQVAETTEQLFACTLTANPLLIGALYSDRYLARVYGGIPGMGALENQPKTVEDGLELPSTAFNVTDVQELGDGRVSATIKAPWGTNLILFVREGGHLLVDDLYLIHDDATAIP